MLFLFSLLVGIALGQTYTAQVYRTHQANKNYFEKLPDVNLGNGNPSGNTVTIDTNQKYQEILGFGGAFTETSAYNWDFLNAGARQEVLKLLFDPNEGLDMSVCRTHINSPDFALEEYTYVTDNDPELKTFNLGQDRKYVLPFIKAAKEIQGDNLLLFGSPWSPPAFMKTNNRMEGGGNLRKESYGPWALYFVKYLQAYKNENINFWGVTVQNEPLASQSWESCIYSGQEEGDFASHYLRPALNEAGFDYIKIQVWDHNKDVTERRADESYGIDGALSAIWGVANHWYGGDHFEALDNVHKKYPDHHLTTTEFCRGDGGGQGNHDDIPHSNWYDMEAYAHEIIGDLNNWVEAITDWNMIVDENAGPYHNRNGGVKASVVVNHTSNSYSVGYIYHSIGHFSRFIKRGSVRVGVDIAGSMSGLEITAAQNKNGTIAVVALNRSGNNYTPYLKVNDGAAQLDVEAHSLTTFFLTPK